MSYYSISTFIEICKVHNLYLDNIEFINTHGGSLRVYLKHNNNYNKYYNELIDKYIQEENNLETSINSMFSKLNLWKKEMFKLINNIKKK